MFATNTQLSIIDSAFGVIESVSEFDFIRFGEKIIDVSLVITATTHAVISYVITAIMLWWLENGPAIMANTVRVVIIAADFAGNCYLAGRDFRRFTNHWVAQLTDQVYYHVIA